MQTTDPTKNVKDWLASSQNHFSAPLISSQQSIQVVLPPVQLSSSKIQIHTLTKKKTQSPVKSVHKLQFQEDWDKIEVLPDTEEYNTKNKKDIVVPIDPEPLFINDNEYTTGKPRRSSRKREIKPDAIPLKRDVSSDKVSKNSSTDTEKHLLKTKQNWNSVKKMRKEFGKLNKKNKSKLNVSIEMCKKAQSKSKRQPITPPDTSKQQIHNVNNNTPYITKENTPENPTIAGDKEILNTDLEACKNTPDESSKVNTARTSKSENNCRNLVEMDVDNNQHKTLGKSIAKSMVIDNSPSNNSGINKSKSETNVTNTANMPFIQKSRLRQPSPEGNCIEIIQNEIDTNTISTNNDDIEISIKVGSSITNIVIKKKQNDMQLKLNTDRGIQTCLGPYGLIGKNDVACSPIKAIPVQNIELNIGDGNKVEVNKSIISTKKNTASADTTTAQFEITDSVERELSNIMECIVPGTHKKSQKTRINVKSPQVNEIKPIEIENDIPEDVEGLDDLGLFNSGSVKETDVQLLKNTVPAQSEILITSNKIKNSQKHPDKRVRDVDVNDIKNVPQSKKQKIKPNTPDIQKQRTDSIDVSLKVLSTSQVQDSENMNYDVIMSQVFANIDADIKSSQRKTTTRDMSIETTTKQTDYINSKQKTQLSQVLHKTPVTQRKSNSVIEVQNASITKDIVNDKYSENMFSMLDKDSDPQETTGKNNQVGANSQNSTGL